MAAAPEPVVSAEFLLGCAAAWRGGWVLGAAAAADRVRQEAPQDGQSLAGPEDGAVAEAGAERVQQGGPRGEQVPAGPEDGVDAGAGAE
eukprot:12705183-Alexandrium_andersonii.AAC.1